MNTTYDLGRLGYEIGDTVKYAPTSRRMRDAHERRAEYMSGPIRDRADRALAALVAERMVVVSIDVRGAMVPVVNVRCANGGVGSMFACDVEFAALDPVFTLNASAKGGAS